MALVSELKEHIPITDLTNLVLDYRYDFSYEKQEVINELKYKFREAGSPPCEFFSAPEFLEDFTIEQFIKSRIKYEYPHHLTYYSNINFFEAQVKRWYDYRLYKQEQEEQPSKRTRV
jgi:hypothetical protein